jgi:3-oxoacyl-[acyl-carrier-protein] synthase-3
MTRVKITATGSYAPERVLRNSELEEMVDTSDKWIMERTGIRERRIAAASQTASEMAHEASKRALDSAGLSPSDLDMIIVATVSGDMPFPSTACLLQHKLDIKGIPAFDLNAACSGFVYGLALADSLVRTGGYRRILLVGAEVLSKVTDWEDRTTCVIFGDGAGAVILEGTDEDRGILATHLHSDGSLGELLSIPAGGSRLPASRDTVAAKQHFIKMRGNETFKVAVRALESVALETLEKAHVDPSQLSLLIPHQANLRIIQATASRLGLPMDKVMVNVDRYGNTSAASIPIALDEALKGGRIREGDLILLEAFGGGLTWASALIRW